jgi:tripartite-type tricarboxylate transporter receptor subunit TctC
MRFLKHLQATSLCLIGLAGAGNSFSDDSYPSRPIRMIVAYPAGGGTDILARMIGQKLNDLLGQSVVIDNRGGANGNIGSELAAKATPDGYTLLMGTANLTVNPGLYRKLGYQPLKDFVPIVLVTKQPNILVVHPSVTANSVKELISLAKTKPSQLNFASNGAGASSHLSGELMKIKAGIIMTHVPYKGAGPALAALLANEVQLMFANTLAALPHVRSNRLRALAITSLQRSAALPELPTMAESGLPDYEVVAWYGVLAPAGTPRAVVTKLNRDIVKVVRQPDIQDRLLKDAANPVGSTPDEFAAFMRSETVKWAQVIKDSGARVD